MKFIHRTLNFIKENVAQFNALLFQSGCAICFQGFRVSHEWGSSLAYCVCSGPF